MIDQQIKRKIINTISRYEEKCDHLRSDINTLKAAINHLLGLQVGIDYEVDKLVSTLKKKITDGGDTNNIEQEVIMLVEIVRQLKKKPQDNQADIN